ncbi:MAG: DUF2231 domain-containing protein [bacterium]|jgi:uncharacterized membrane protein
MIVELLGRLHPAVVHFPIGILILAFVLQYLSPRQIRERSELIWFVLLVGAASALLAALLGWILSWSGEYAETAVSRHQWPGIYLCIASALLVYVYKIRERSKLNNQLVHALFTSVMILLLITAHYGASLTHGSGYLFESTADENNYSEDKSKSLVKEEADSSMVSSDRMLPALPLPDSILVNNLKKIGLVVKPLAAGTNALEINAVNFSSFGDKDVVQLSGVAENILWLHLADTKITDASAKQIAACKYLTRLDLRGTSLGRTALAEFTALKELNYLNMVGTALDDEALAQFVPPASLTHFYCWNTKVTKAALEQFRSKYPKVVLNEGNL